MASPAQWPWVWVNSGSWDGQEGLACCNPWGHKELATTEWLNWTCIQLNLFFICMCPTADYKFIEFWTLSLLPCAYGEPLHVWWEKIKALKHLFITSSELDRASLVTQLVKNLPAIFCLPGDLALIPGKRKGYPLHYSGLENSMDCIVHVVTKSWTWVGDFYFHWVR